MKFLGCILLLSINSLAFSQGVVIEPAPLSIQDDGSRKIINRKEGEIPTIRNTTDVISPPAAEALVIPNDDVINPPGGISVPKHVVIEVVPAPAHPEKQAKAADPIDGQLKLNGSSSVNSHETSVENNVSDDLFSEYEAHTMNKYLQFSFGYIDSDYKKIHPSLENGSSTMSFKFVADISARLQSGFALEVLSDKSGKTVTDSIRAIQYRMFFDYHSPLLNNSELRIDWLVGFGFSLGDYGIRRHYVDGLGQDVSIKVSDGVMIGLIPVAGVRIYLFDQNSFDIMAEYHQYFSTPQKHIGGLAIAPRFSFIF